MRVDRDQRPERLLNSRAQFRQLWRLLLLLALMLYAVHWASQGRHWLWLTEPTQPPSGPELRELEMKPKSR